MIPCSDYPPTENGESVSEASVGRIEGGNREPLPEQQPAHSPPSDLDASHPSPASSSSPSLVEELMGMVEEYGEDYQHQWCSSFTCNRMERAVAARESLRSRLTALETELRELARYRAIEADKNRPSCKVPESTSASAPGYANGSWAHNHWSAKKSSSPRTTEPL